MHPRRLVVLVTSALLVSVGLAWRATEPLFVPSGLVRELLPGVSYAVGIRGDRCCFDLPFSSNSRYMLVVSSLAGSEGNYRVTLKADDVAVVSKLPVRRIEPLAGCQTSKSPGMLRSLHSPRSDNRSRLNAGAEYRTTIADGGKQRTFYLHVTDGSLENARHYARVESRVVAEGAEVRVYLDRQVEVNGLAPGLLQDIVRILDNDLIPVYRRRLGAYRDIDGDGKFSVLLSPWLGRLQGGRTSLGGFVRGDDFRRNLAAPFSNCCDMLYLNSSLQPGPHLRTLLAHEYTHAVCISERLPSDVNGACREAEEDWLNEAIAHVAERRFGATRNGGGWSNLDYRISRYLSEPAKYPLVVGDYYRAGLWRDHGCRGATYLFLQWCADQFGDALLSRLIRSPAGGTRNLEWATGVRFDELYRRWSIATYLSGRRSRTLPTREANSAPTSETGLLRSIDLRGPLGRWGLAGPRSDIWDVASGSRELILRGTTTAYLEMGTSGPAGVRRIALQGDYGTDLQVTIIRIADDWPEMEIEAGWIPTAASTSEDPKLADSKLPNSKSHRQRRLRVRIAHPVGSELVLESIACEFNQAQSRQTFCFRPDQLARFRVQEAEGIKGVRTLFYELPVTLEIGDAGNPIIKAVAHDARGRRTTAWSEVPRRSDSPGPLRLTRAPEHQEPR